MSAVLDINRYKKIRMLVFETIDKNKFRGGATLQEIQEAVYMKFSVPITLADVQYMTEWEGD